MTTDTEDTHETIEGNAFTPREHDVIAFYDAAEALIATAPVEAQRAAMEVVMHLAATFGGDVQAEGVERVKGWAETLRKDAGLYLRRARCIDAVHQWGSKVRSDPEHKLVHAAGLIDSLQAFGAEAEELRVNPNAPKDKKTMERVRKACPWAEAWRGELQDVAARLNAYDPSPSGKEGAKGAASILAAMIVDGGSFLGLSAEDAIDDIRKALDKAVRESRKTLNHARKRL